MVKLLVLSAREDIDHGTAMVEPRVAFSDEDWDELKKFIHGNVVFIQLNTKTGMLGTVA
jgi:hypothetical protein